MSSRLLVVPNSPSAAPKPRMPVLRLSENFFQRWFLILLPVIVMAAIGVFMAQRTTPEYLASATLSTSANPLVGAQEIRGTSIGFFESPADATARVMNERLGTDRFAAGVAERAGLSGAIENGFLSYDDLRGGVAVFSVGESLVDIQAGWGDPNTSLELVDAIIAEYLSVLRSTVSEDSQSAVDFYEARRDEAAVSAQSAADAYETFLQELPFLPEGVEMSLADELELGRLNDRLASAQGAIDTADSAIEDALLSVVRAQSEAGRSIQIVDPPSSTFEPESTLTYQATAFFAAVFLGLLVALTILLLSTYLDRSVRSAGDIEAAGGGVAVAAVPVIKSLRPRKRVRRAVGVVGNAPHRIVGRVRRAG